MRAIVASIVVMSWGASAQADVAALLDQAKAAAARKEHAKVVAALEDALTEARREAPLTASPFVLITEKAAFFGAYTPRRDAVFGGSDEMRFYLEPKNLVYPRRADGTYAPAFTVDYEILDATGAVVSRGDKFGDFGFTSKSRLQDIYVNLALSLTGAPPGKYTVRFTLRDKNSPKTAILTQPFTWR